MAHSLWDHPYTRSRMLGGERRVYQGGQLEGGETEAKCG